MFRTKKDVERHVADVLSKIDNENEKNLRGYTFARLFFQVKDYESARKYLTGFLSVRHHHAASHKLLAQIYVATNNPENALQSYKRSLEIDPQQNDIVLKICEMYCQLPVDHETARYWADRAEQLFPHHDTIFKLREYLVSAEGEPDRKELENLIASDLAAQPKNVDRRIKLLRLYLDTERVEEAYVHATMIESKRLFPYSIDWYYVLGDIFEAYQEEHSQELDCQFYINYLTALDHLIFLTLAEPHAFSLENGKKSSLNDAAAALLTFDQLLKKAIQKDTREGSWTYFIHHMKGQLYFHMTSLLMKRTKMDQGNRKEAFRFSAGLAVVCYTFKPVNLLHEVWFSQMEDNQKAFTNFFQQGSLRTSFIGHVLLSLCKDDKSCWVQKIKTEVCIPQVKERIYSRIFSSLFQKEKLSSSYFISDSTFEQSSLELPSEVALKEYDKSAYKLCPDSLHHLVWLELHRENARISSPDTITEIFKNLQYSNKNLSKGSCESLCVLDLEAYLHAAVYQSKFIIERKNNVLNARNESLLSYPPDVTDALCTTVQAAWWKSAYGLYNSSIKEKLGEHRRNLQHGLEVIRGIGNHGMEVQLVIHLAHTFSSKADTLDKATENKTDKNKNKLATGNATSLYSRATHYWNIALGMLEKLASGKTMHVQKDPMFIGSSKSLSKKEIKTCQEEGQLFLAVRLMDSDKLNEAAELLSKLSSPYGSYYLALTLKKLASQEQKFSSTRTALLTKAKNSILDTMDRIKDDKTHPLNKEIFIDLEDVENELALELSIASENSCEDADEIDSYDESPIQNLSYLQDNDKSVAHSTPRPSSKFMTPRCRIKPVSQMSPTQHFEPSPERLDSQIRALALNQDTLVKSFFQQQQTLLETNKSIVEALKQNKEVVEQLKQTLVGTNKSIVEALKQNKEVVEQLKKKLEELSLADLKVHPKAVLKKPVFLKGQGDEEDYYDPNGILDYYEDGGEDYRASGYNFDRTSRMPHDPAAAASLNYVVPPALPPGPPPALNHYNYQYPPHAVLPTPPPAVPERPPYYHPPGQGLPFNEGQQLPQFHFHVASSIGKPPPTLSTSLPQVVPGLPPPPVSIPSLSVSMPPPPVAPLSAPNPWTTPVTVPHAFQIPLPPSTVIVSGSNSLGPTVTQVAPSTALPVVTTSHSQLKDLLQTPISRTITFGQPSTTTVPVSLTVSPSIFSELNKTPEAPKERSRYESETATSPDIDGHDVEREVMGDYKPLIPLPAEIVVETGEENEVVLFEDRAKLYRFVDQEWKERGIGVVKILHHEGSKRVRLLMRRDQVLKVCANHYITSNMEIHPLKNSDKAWTWGAEDFADEILRPEHFCIRFKTPEIAAAFKTAFEKAINISKESEAKKIVSPKVATVVTTSTLSKEPFGAQYLPKPGSWTCPTCYVSNSGDKFVCAACETKKPGSSTLPKEPFGAQYLPKPGSWTCSTCYVSNSGDKFECAACETKKPGSQTSVTSSVISTVTTTAVASGFNIKSFQTTTASTGFKFGLPISSSSSMLSTVTPTNSTKIEFGGFTFSSNPVIQDAETPEVKEREILVVSTKSKNGPEVTKVNTPKTSPFTGLTFKSPSVTTTISSNQSSTNNLFSGFSFPAITTFPTVTVTAASTQSTPSVHNTTSGGISISSIQNSMSHISPAFSFSKVSTEKDASATVEDKSSSSEANVSRSVFTNVSSDTSKSSEFLFGVKPTTQPTTFSFGLSALSKSNETVGFKPALPTTSNAPAIFGGATQKTETSQNVCIFGGATPKTEPSQISSAFGGSQNIFGGTSSKSDPCSGLASIFGVTPQKTDAVFGGTAAKAEPSQISPGFGGQNITFGIASPKSDPCSGLVSTFGSISQKTDSVTSTSIFAKSATTSDCTPSTPVFGGSSEKSDTSKPVAIEQGVISKPETCSSSSFPTVTTTSQSVFNFGSASQNKGETCPVEFRFGSPQKYEFNFSGVRPRSPTKTPKCPRSPATPSDVEEDEENESFDADNIYFQPVIPLPPKVDVKTGEENEITLFCKRAKLFRFCSGEWKERGIGDIKILHDEVGKKVRLLMRRDQVLKVCLNHYLTKDITFEKRGDKTLQWAVTDFSENEPQPELFAVRFKTSEFADEFITVIENSLNCNGKENVVEDINKAAAAFSFKADTGTKTESLFTPGCLTARFGISPPAFGNKQSSADATSSSNTVTFTFKDIKPTGTFFNVASSSNDQSVSDKEKSETVAIETKEINQIGDDDDIQFLFETLPSDEDIDLAKKYLLPTSFYLYKDLPPCPGCIGCEEYIPPPKSTSDNSTVTSTSSSVNDNKSTSQVPESGIVLNAANSLTFADLASNSASEGLSTSSQKKVFEGAGTPLFANLNCSTEADGDDEAVAQGPDIHFEPVIPLPELVAVKTGEEDETPIFVNRAKLFRFDSNKKEWKERGVGDLKILKHNETLRFRIILRRDQVHKIACNHCISVNMELSPLATSETALCWNALDYSEGQPEASQFAVRFKSKDLLQQFKQTFNECKEKLKKGENEPPAALSDNQSNSLSGTPAKEMSPTKDPVSQNEHDSSGSETNEDDEDSDNESLFEKRVSFEISDGNDNEFKQVGIGSLKILYDDTVFGYHVYMTSDTGDCLCDHIIAIQTALRTENKRATWTAIDLSIDPPRRRRFRANFSSLEALKEFSTCFEEGKEAALHSEIVEKTDYFYPPKGQQT